MDDLDMNKVRDLLNEFGVDNENELYGKLMGDWDIIQCIRCGKETHINNLHSIDGDPVCSDCIWENNNE